MPEIRFSRKVIEQVKKREGIYRQLPYEDKTSSIKEFVMKVIQESFIEYARKHGCAPDQEMKEWTRFCRILEKKL